MCYFLVTLILAISSICQGRRDDGCDVLPKDRYIESGSNATITCKSSCVGGRVYWTLNNTRVDESSSAAVNASHTELTLRNFTHALATLQCHSATTQLVIGGTTLRTYLKPTHISCIWHYASMVPGGVPELFTCKWEHPMNSREITYTVLLASSLQPTPTEVCSSRVKSCTPKTKMPFKITVLENVVVTVRAKTPAWEASSSTVLDPSRIWKMSCSGLSATALADHLLVNWMRIPIRKTCLCQVKYNELLLNKTLDRYEEGSVAIHAVDSCTDYRVSVRCRLEGAPWSDWSPETTVLTKLRKSDVRLRLWRKVGEPTERGVRKVHAMWTDIPRACRGTFTHVLEYSADAPDDATGVNFENTSCGDTACELILSRHAHRLNLTVLHDGALLAQDSVYVPAVGESLPQVTDLQASTHEGAIVVRWSAPLRPVTGYMIDWTRGGDRYHWRESGYANVTLLDLLDKTPYNITVTPLFEDKTGLGTRALQICSRVGGPGNVSIDAIQANDKTVHVSWSIKSQEACSGAVVSYTVFYGTASGRQLNVTVDSAKREVSLKHLTPDTEYSVSVRAAARTGTTESGDRRFNTKRFDPRLVTALSVCGTIVIVLVLSLGLCCAVQWKKFKEKPVPKPVLRSVELWPSASQQKPYNTPSESFCEQVYMEEAQQTPTPPPASDGRLNPPSNQVEYTEPVVILAPAKRPLDPSEVAHQSSPAESTGLLSSESSPMNPYRSQTSVKTSTPKSGKQGKRLVPIFQEKTAPVTVYVTMDMFEQGQGR